MNVRPSRLSFPMQALTCAWLLAASIGLSSCVDQVGLIDRTSPNKYEKGLFEGVWMYSQTTVDVPYSTAASFTGEMNFFADNFKLIFDITEDKLIAYPVVEKVDGTEKGWRSRDIRNYWDPDKRGEFVEMYVGQAVAIWPITSHFDLIRRYNSYNGAQSNELTENTTDRPWYERDYIHVNWSGQMLQPFFYDLMGGNGQYSFFAGDSKLSETDKMTIDKEGGYFDYVVSTMTGSAGQYYCSTYKLSAYDCSSAMVKVRHAFRRLDPRRDYEPIRYHNSLEQDKFGFFATSRAHYDDDYGHSYAGELEWANRWNLWLNSYSFELPVNEAGEPLTIPCNVDYDCDDEAGERCQKTESWFEEGTCMIPVPLPYSERGHRPIIYHLNTDWHEDYIAEAYATAEGWNDVFKETVSWQLLYDERGEYAVRGCTLHSDCATDDLLVDVNTTVTRVGVTCHSDEDCDAAFCSPTTGLCATSRACDSDTPCAIGQQCSAGTCVDGQGDTIEQAVDATDFRASSVIYHRDGHLVTHDNFTTPMVSRLAGATGAAERAWVRFIHAAPEAGSVSLEVACVPQCDGNDCGSDGCGGTCGLCNEGDVCNFQGVCEAYTADSACIPDCAGKSGCDDNGCGGACGACSDTGPSTTDIGFAPVVLAGGEYDANRDYDPQDPATHGMTDLDSTPNDWPAFMAAVPQVKGYTGLRFQAKQDGTVLAASGGDIVAGNSYTVVFNGEDVLVFASSFPDSERGVRFIHASPNEGALDFSLAGVRVATAANYGTATSYENIAGDIQRGTVSRAGARGDFTCYTKDDVGRCVGWGADVTEADLERRLEIKANLPDLYVLCENTYDELSALDQANRDASAATRAELMIPEAIEHSDTHYFGDAWYTYDLADGTDYNPCGDPSLVAHPTEPKRIGDIRYSFFYWVNEMQRSGPLGYGPSLADPDTGQLISATANIYGGVVHTYSQYAADLLNLVNGDIDTEDVITGEWVRQALAAKAPSSPNADPTATFQGALSDHSAHSHGHHAHGHDRLVELSDGTSIPQKVYDQLVVPQRIVPEWEYPEMIEFMRHPHKFKAHVEQTLPAVDLDHNHRRLGMLKGTMIEQLMINTEVEQLGHALDPDGDLSPTELQDLISPVNWGSKYAMQAEEARIDFFARNNMYMGEFLDDALWGLAKELQAKGLSGEALRLEVGRRVLRGVLEHEVGHTVGLRHNFSGSADIFNFHDKWYETRDKDLIFCKDDDACDTLAGEVCALSTCNTDDDCIVGTLCVNGECSGPTAEDATTLTPTGVCSLIVSESSCNTADDCADDGICYNNRCHTPNRQFVPRASMTDNEKGAKRTEYQSSTVMDYGGRFNSDIQGLGKYDYAAIMFGYSQLVETYTETDRIYGRVDAASELTGQPPEQYSFYLNTDFWPNRGMGFYHPFMYLTQYIGVEENKARLPRPFEQVEYQKEMVTNDIREYYDFEYIEVPYAYCSDEFRGNLGCNIFDMGVDMGEMASHSLDQLNQYYIFDAFKRERTFFGSNGNAMSYFSRIFSRYFNVLGDVGMYYAFYDTLLFRYSWYQSWQENPMGGASMKRSAQETFGYLQDVVSSPAPGSYKLVDKDNGERAYVNFDLDTDHPDSDLNIPLGVGRFPYTQYGQSLGYNWREHPMWFGSFWEKLGAMLTLTDSTAYFVDNSVGEQLNIGVGTSLGFNTVFSDEMNAFLGGIISDRMGMYSGVFDVQSNSYLEPSQALRSNATDVASDKTGFVEPGLNTFTLKLYAAVYGLAYLPAGFDPRFVDTTAVWLEGEATNYDVDTGALQEYRFEDPIGGKVYVAYDNNYGDYNADKISAGKELVVRAQNLADQWQEATGTQRLDIERDLSSVREMLDVLRNLNQIYSASTLGF